MDTQVIEALNAWAEVWSQTDLAGDIAEQLACSEVDAHYVAPAPEYEVPVDPMDLLQCDSCQ